MSKKLMKIEDGIINKEIWDKAKLKVLVLLKESYGTLGGTFSICSFLNKRGAYGQTHKPTGRIMYYLNNIEIDDQTGYGDCIKAGAIINCINYNNLERNTRTSWEKLNAFCTEDRMQEIVNQIVEINPDVIICGGTYWYLKNRTKLGLPDLGLDEAYKIVGSPLDGKVIYNAQHFSYRKRGTHRWEVDQMIAKRIKDVM